MIQEKYDAIVIGSGIGGLTTAALLAKAYNQKVLVLERHWTLGGLTHEFERQRKYSWDVGVHYIGYIKEGEVCTDVFDYITDGQLEWQKIKDPFDTFWYPDFRFGVPSDMTKYREEICKLFPEEKKAIFQFFKDVLAAMNWGANWFLKETLPRPLSWGMGFLYRRKRAFFMQSTKAYFDKNFKNPKLKALLTSQWGDYGMTPEHSCFWAHAMIVGHYIRGGYYPKGGSKMMAKYIIPTIEKSGGQCLIGCDVNEILVKDGKAIGCTYRTKEGNNWVEKTVYADNIISNAGAINTFRKLLRNPIHPEIEDLEAGRTAMTIYLGLKENPAEKLGVTGGNFWLFSHYNHDQLNHNDNIGEEEIEFCFLSFPSLKDPSRETHTAEIIVFTDFKSFESWQHTDWQKRGEEYEKLKAKVAEKCINFIEKRLSGFKGLVDFSEVSTPLSLRNFTNRDFGAMYGLPVNKARYDLNCLNAKTSIKNLYLTGTDVLILGVAGGTLGGVVTASKIGSKMGLISLYSKIKMDIAKRKKLGQTCKITE